MMRTGLGFVFLGAASLLVLLGLALCLWAAYLWLAASLGPAGAAALIGVVSLILAGGLTWIAMRLSR
ncbi:MAG: hypothetical protein P8Y64_13160 [Gammaproteobacteria bacterium]|jgi:hypothetical protein